MGFVLLESDLSSKCLLTCCEHSVCLRKYTNWMGTIMRTDPDYSKLVSITKMSTTKPYVQRLPLFRIIRKGYTRGWVL